MSAAEKKPVPARIHVLLARDAPIGVIFRRGPSRQVATMLWNRKTDQFSMGQWFKGRIYERRADLSPDGKYLIYLASKYETPLMTWTAISYAPFLKALVLYEGTGTYYGGGLWVTNESYWLNAWRGQGTVIRDAPTPYRDRTYEPPPLGNAEDLGVYYPRLLRDGWKLVEGGTRTSKAEIFEKPAGPHWILRKIAHVSHSKVPGRGVYWDSHDLFHPKSSTLIHLKNCSWAEVDGKHVIWVEDGQLMRARITSSGLESVSLIQDFSDMSFEPLQAPY